MAIEKYIPVGKLLKPHKLSGAFRFLLERSLKAKKKLPGHFMLNTNGNYLPWFIKDIEWTAPDEGIVLFEEVSSPEKAKLFSGHQLYLAENELSLYFKKESQNVDYLVGYNVITEGEVEIGQVAEILETPGQTLLSIQQNGREILIPFVEEFIVKISRKKKELILDLPEGLI